MKVTEKTSTAFFEGISYGLTGTVFVFLAIGAIESFAEITSGNPNAISFSNDDFGREGIGVIPLFLGLSISAVSVISILGEQKNNVFLRWLAILLLSVLLTVVLQKIFLIYYFQQPIGKLFDLLGYEHERLGLWWAVRLSSILAPFTLLFTTFTILLTNRRSTVGKVRNLDSLR